jgi:hypothetical protein
MAERQASASVSVRDPRAQAGQGVRQRARFSALA